MNDAVEALIERLDRIVQNSNDGDWALVVETASECGWSAEVRVTRESRPMETDRSIVFYKTGEDAEDALLPALLDAIAECETWGLLESVEQQRLIDIPRAYRMRMPIPKKRGNK